MLLVGNHQSITNYALGTEVNEAINFNIEWEHKSV